MSKRPIVIAIALCVLVGAVCLAADMQMGTWKLNDAKSKMDPKMGKNTMVTVAAEGDNVKVTVDGVDPAGKPTHNEWTGKFDGKDYAVTGDPTSDMRSYKKVDDHKLDLVVKKAGKVTMEGTVEVSKDGKTRTLTIHGTTADGAKVTGTAVYDKQ